MEFIIIITSSSASVFCLTSEFHNLLITVHIAHCSTIQVHQRQHVLLVCCAALAASSVTNPVETRCMAIPSLIGARWVGQNSGPIVCRLFTKVHRIKFACVGVSVVCNAIFQLTTSCCIPETFAIKSQSCANCAKFLCFWGRQISRGRGYLNFWLNFINLGYHQTCGKVWWRSAKRPRRLGGEKKKEDLNYNGKTK